MAIRVQQQTDFFGGSCVIVDADQGGLAAVNNDVLRERCAQADQHLSVVVETGVDAAELGELAQQQVTLVQQFCRLLFKRWHFAELAVDLGQLLGQGVDLAHAGLHRFAGFAVNQVQLRGQQAKASGQAFSVTHKSAAQHSRSRVGRQRAGRRKKLVERADQAHALSTHHIDHAVGVLDHGHLALELRVAVAQVGLGKCVVLALHAVKNNAGANGCATELARRTRHKGDVLARITVCGDVGDVVTHGPQRTLVGHDGVAADAKQVAHGLLLVLRSSILGNANGPPGRFKGLSMGAAASSG